MDIGSVLKLGLFDTAECFPGMKKTPLRTVKKYELEYIISSEGSTTLDGVTYRLSPGAFICAKPGQTRNSLFGFRCYYLHMDAAPGSRYEGILQAAPDCFRLIDTERYRRIFEDLLWHEMRHPGDFGSDFVTAKLLELFYYMEHDTPRNGNLLRHAREGDRDLLPPAIAFMKENYGKRITLADIAGAVGYSPNYFHHVFTDIMGVTPQKYLLSLRIRHAKEELIGTGRPLIDIALDCGFSSQSYFNAQFRQQTRLTPSQYRRMNLKKYNG